jgi:hypothetical protein
MSITALRSAVTTAGGTPTQWTQPALLRQLITAWSGSPTEYTVIRLLRQAITASGGTPTQFNVVMLLRELITTLGTTPTSFEVDALYAQMATLANIPVAGAPANTALPAISGTLRTGSTLSTTNGTWTNTPTSYGYQWYRAGIAIASATASTYVLVSADEGSNITVRVAATNATGTGFSTSAAVGPALPLAPTNSVAPVASGTAVQGNVLSVTNGTWANSPTSYTYQWKRDGTSIGSATGNTYTLVAGDVGANITCDVTGSNAGGSATATSNTIGPIAASGGLSAPVLTQTSAATVNPLEWDSNFTGYVTWDPVALAGDRHLMRWRRVPGGAWTTEVEQPLDDELITGGFTWPLWEAAKPLAAGYVEVQEQRARYSSYPSCVTTNASAVVTMASTTGILAGAAITGAGVVAGTTVLSVNSGTQITMSANATASATVTLGVETMRSAWSNALTDTLAGTAFVPSSLFGGSDVGYAFDTTDLTKMWQSNGGTTAAAFASPVGRLDDISGKSNNFASSGNDTTRPTLANVSNGLVQYDGSNDKLRLGAAPLYAAGAMTWMFAARVSAVAGKFLFSEGWDTGGTLYAPYTRQLGAAGEDNYCQITDTNSSSWVSNTVNTNDFDNTLRIFTVTDTGALITVYVGGTSLGSVAYSRSGHTVTLNNSYFGCWAPNISAQDFLTGYLGCGAAIGRVLGGPHTTAGSELNNLYNWIAGKHGLSTI